MRDLYDIVESILDDEDDIMGAVDAVTAWMERVKWSDDPVKNFIFREIYINKEDFLRGSSLSVDDYIKKFPDSRGLLVYVAYVNRMSNTYFVDRINKPQIYSLEPVEGSKKGYQMIFTFNPNGKKIEKYPPHEWKIDWYKTVSRGRVSSFRNWISLAGTRFSGTFELNQLT